MNFKERLLHEVDGGKENCQRTFLKFKQLVEARDQIMNFDREEERKWTIKWSVEQSHVQRRAINHPDVNVKKKEGKKGQYVRTIMIVIDGAIMCPLIILLCCEENGQSTHGFVKKLKWEI